MEHGFDGFSLPVDLSYSLPPQSILDIKKQADRLVKQADAYGVSV
jgi:hypothetical protein